MIDSFSAIRIPVIVVASHIAATRNELTLLLHSQGYQIQTAETGQAALSLVKDSLPALMLVEAALPDIAGFEVCQRLKQQQETYNLPIILLIAASADTAQVFTAGATDYLSLPLEANQVLARIAPYLAWQEAQARLSQQMAAFNTLTTRLHQELTVAHDIQRGLLPPDSPYWPGLEVQCYTQAAREVGGDFYTYHTFDTRLLRNEKRYAIAVGDVSGKGMPAALLMAISLASFKNLITQVYSFNKLVTDMVTQTYSLGQFLMDLDKAIAFYTATTRQNCALVYAELIRPAVPDKPVTMRVVNAGCVTPIIRRADGTVVWVEVGGMPLGAGLSAEFGYVEQSLPLNRGDMMILTSDGVVEANNQAHQMFGFDRLEQTVKEGPQNSAQSMLEHLKNAINSFVGDTEQHDDLTIVVIRS